MHKKRTDDDLFGDSGSIFDDLPASGTTGSATKSKKTTSSATKKKKTGTSTGGDDDIFATTSQSDGM